LAGTRCRSDRYRFDGNRSDGRRCDYNRIVELGRIITVRIAGDLAGDLAKVDPTKADHPEQVVTFTHLVDQIEE